MARPGGRWEGFIAGGLAYFTWRKTPRQHELRTSRYSLLASTLNWLAQEVSEVPRWPVKAIELLQSKHLLMSSDVEDEDVDAYASLYAARACVREVERFSDVKNLKSMELEGWERSDNNWAAGDYLAYRLPYYVDDQLDHLIDQEGNDCHNTLAAMLSPRCPVLRLSDIMGETDNDEYLTADHALVVDFDAEIVSVLDIGDRNASSPDPWVLGTPGSWDVISCASLRSTMELTHMADELLSGCWMYDRTYQVADLERPLFSTKTVKGWIKDRILREPDDWTDSFERKAWQSHRLLQRWQRLSTNALRSFEQSTCAVNFHRPPGFSKLKTRHGDLFKADMDLSRLPDDYQPSHTRVDAHRTTVLVAIPYAWSEKLDTQIESRCEPFPAGPTSSRTSPSCAAEGSGNGYWNWNDLDAVADELPGQAYQLTLDEATLDAVDVFPQLTDDDLRQRIRDRKANSNQQLSNAELAVEFGLSESKVQRLTCGLPPKRRRSSQQR